MRGAARRTVRCNVEGAPALGSNEVKKKKIKCDIHRSRFSSRMTSSSRAPLPWTQRSTQASQVCSSSRNVHGRVQSSTITTAVCGRADCGCRKCGTRAVYEGADEGTVYTDNRARISVNVIRDALMRIKWTKDLLLPRRVRRPSRILRQSLCVARLFLHPLVVFGEEQRQGCSFQLMADQVRGHFLLVLSGRKTQN